MQFPLVDGLLKLFGQLFDDEFIGRFGDGSLELLYVFSEVAAIPFKGILVLAMAFFYHFEQLVFSNGLHLFLIVQLDDLDRIVEGG